MDWDVDLHWLLTGDGRPTRSGSDTTDTPPGTRVGPIDPELLTEITGILDRVQGPAKRSADRDSALLDLAHAYNLLIAKADDPTDRPELKSLLPWLETQLGKRLGKR